MDTKERLNKAAKFAKEEKFGQAEAIYLELLKENPNDLKLLVLYGYLSLKARDIEKAEEILGKAYDLETEKSIPVLKGLAIIKSNLEKIDEAINFYKQLIVLEPVYDNYKHLTSLLAHKIGFGKDEYLIDAKNIIEFSYKKFPLDPEIMLGYATYKFYTGYFDEAEKVCRNVLKIKRDYAKAWELLGFIYEGVYCNESSAQECHRNSIEYGLKGTGYYNLGVSYSKDGYFDKAIECFDKAESLVSGNVDIIRHTKALTYLKQRNFNEGYKIFVEYSDSKFFNVLENKWTGEEHKDKTLLVLLDMCYGDHIFFARYLPFLSKKFERVIVQIPSTLRKIFEDSFKGIEFINDNEIPDYDYYTVLSHLPYYLNIDFNNIPYSGGYLISDSYHIESKKLKVGLCWEAGNIDTRTTIHRTINVLEFKKLLQQDCAFYSFQLSPVMDITKYGEVVDLSSKIKDFSDTAKYLKSMDVLVSVDTSVPNLAGALGVKTFMLIPYYSDWRWFDNTERTEWYDSITIYKQTEKHSWQNELNRIIDDLNIMKK